MQSQQKKVKWSRGETADALEERTDTGITQVSVSKLENIVADIYGNISRRPALKIVSQANTHPITPVGAFAQIPMSTRPATFVFTVNESKYIILVVGQYEITGYLIENEKFVRTVKFTDKDNDALDMSGIYFPYGKAASFAQSNNWAVLSGVWLQDKIIRLTGTDDITVEEFKFSAPWYAPGGTQSKTINDATLAGLEFNKDGLGFTAFSWTDNSGNASPYSIIDTGLDGSTTDIEEAIPIGSVVKFPNLGCYMRVEGYNLGGHTVYFGDYDFDATSTDRNPTGTGLCADISNTPEGNTRSSMFRLIAYRNGVEIGRVKVAYGTEVWVRFSSAVSGYKKVVFTRTKHSIPGQSPYYTYTAAWDDVASSALDVQMFGPLLTPVAKNDAKDTSVTVEYGYISLENYQPHEFAFSQQRLYATRWLNAEHEIPGYAVGSQIAKFNDFKNDYNTQSEAVIIDINTTYQEKVQYIVDYNGVKIFTSDSEYAYSQQAGVAKQSTNGCSPNCRPVIFGAALLYTDKSKRQIRALQYELQTDIYQSNVINQMCQPDLVFNPVGMSIKYDKEYNTGSQLYVVQEPTETTPKAPYLISCNFVPANQAQIWGRWKIPELPTSLRGNFSTIVNTITVNNKPWFIVMGMTTHDSVGTYNIGYSLAELSYDNMLDFEIEADPTDTKYTLTRNDGFPFSLIGWVDDGGSDAIIYTNYEKFDLRTTAIGDPVYNKNGVQIGTISTIEYLTPQSPIPHRITVTGDAKTYYQNNAEHLFRNDLTLPGATVSVFDGDEYKWDDTLDANGNYTKPLTDLTHPRVGFMINAELISHPIDIQGKTYTEKKRIGKAVAVIRDTEPGAFTVCDKTGYMDNDKKKVNFYGCTGMKDEVRYTIKNIQGAKFTIESLTMIIEYATLDS